jgi:hypothetical protein
MMRQTTLLLTVFIVLLVVVCTWEACKKIHIGCGGPMTGNEPTSVMLIFRNVNNPADIDTALWTNYGSNIMSPQAHLTLSANAGYHVSVMFLNLADPTTSSGYNVTPSVQKESSSYLICFTDSLNVYGNLGANLNWMATDLDNSVKPLPIGLTDSFWTGADSACGIMATTLHHQYQVKNGDCDPGYIDIEALDTIYISPNKG